MPKIKNRLPPPNTKSDVDRALDFLDTKMGKDLLRQGATLHRNTGTIPPNVWIESRGGTMLHHSEPDNDLGSNWFDLRPFMVKHEKRNGAVGVRPSDEIIALHNQRILDRKVKKVPARCAPSGPRL